jgi:circadian clock protein KaiC
VTTKASTVSNERVSTGVPGLDAIMGGGLLRGAICLVKGAPGTGKTTVGLQFLIDGASRGEKCLYIGLSETRGQLDAFGKSLGWSLKGIDVHDMRRRGPSEDKSRNAYTVFSPAEVELAEISREMLEQIDRVKPSRLVIDSLSEIRLLAEDSFRYRRELLSLTDEITARGCTALVIDVETDANQSVIAETLVTSVLVLEQLSPEYGGDRRRVRVRKSRASDSVGGYHDMNIGRGGVVIFPRLVARSHRALHSSAEVRSGVAELDALLGGGLDRGTSTVLIGPAGTGKSTIAAQFATEAAAHGEKAAVFCFDESPTNLLIRTTGLRIPLQKYVDTGAIHLVTIDPAEFSPGELGYKIRTYVENGCQTIIIDSLNGYLSSMPEERFLAAHIHELLAFLSEKGVTTLITLAQFGLFSTTETPINISYIADTVLLFRYFEAAGEVRQALSVVKKRTGRHERSIRELKLTSEGIKVGEPLLQFQGVLSGNPQFVSGALLRGERERPD